MTFISALINYWVFFSCSNKSNVALFELFLNVFFLCGNFWEYSMFLGCWHLWVRSGKITSQNTNFLFIFICRIQQEIRIVILILNLFELKVQKRDVRSGRIANNVFIFDKSVANSEEIVHSLQTVRSERDNTHFSKVILFEF